MDHTDFDQVGWFFNAEGVYSHHPLFESACAMNNDVKDNLKSQSTWIRGLYMLIYSIFYTVAIAVIFAVIVFQFLLKLFTGEINERLCKLGQGLSTYI